MNSWNRRHRPFIALSIPAALLLCTAPAAIAGQPKVDVCHRTGAGGFNLINVAAPAVPAHLAHGDHLLLTFWADHDGDGFGAGPASQGCVVPPGSVENGDDCDDTNPAVNPAATEVCNHIDDDCDALIDDADPSVVGQPTWYADADTDTYGNPGVHQLACFQPAGYVSDHTDCNDANGAINPGANEVCNHVDDDCDTLVDDDDPGVIGQPTWYADSDGDGYGNPGSSEQACFLPGGHVGNDDDCNDGNGAVHPGATEVCNGIDDNCTGGIDEGGVCVPNRVFVSSQLYDGNFGGGMRVLGYLNADAACQTLATNAGLGGSWKAWLSGRPDSAGCGPLQPDCDGHGAADRFTHNPGPYNLVNGTKVADSWADLTDGSLDHAIDVTEVNTAVGAEHRVWTNTTTGGAAYDAGTNCAVGPPTDPPHTLFTWSCGPPEWSPMDCNFQGGTFGDATMTNSQWTLISNVACNNTLHIYCFEQ